jgi:hypothetical protein
VYAPNGNEVAFSMTVNANVEIVEFDPTISGTYTIKVLHISGAAPHDTFAIAWW